MADAIIPITVDDAALLKAVLGVVLPSVAIHNPKSKTKNGISSCEQREAGDGRNG